MRTHRKLVLCAAIATVCLGAPKAKATVYDWRGFGINGNWSTLANWDGIHTPGTSDSARFGDTSSLVSTSKVDTSRTVVDLFVDGPSSVGDYTFTGANTTLSVNDFEMTQPLSVVDNATISSGLTVNAASHLHLLNDSHLTISGGGTVVAQDFELEVGSNPKATAVIGSAGTLHLTGIASVIEGGTLELDSGGALNIDSGHTVSLQGSAATFALNTSWAVPAGAGVQVTAGHIIASSTFDVATGNTGTLLVDGSGSSVSAGGPGTFFSQWAGSAGTATVTFSDSGVGTYNTGLRIDNNLGGTATVNVNSGARLSVANGLFVGGGSTNSANITVNSATLAIASGTQSFVDFGQGTTFNLQSGGVLQLGASATFETGSSFNWSGGTITDSGQTLAINGGVASLTISGLNVNNSTLSISSGGHVDSTSYVNVGVIAAGTLLVSGSGSQINLPVVAPSSWGFGTGGTANVTISNSGVASYGTLQVGAAGATGTVNLNSGGVLHTSGEFDASDNPIASAATINIAGGTLNCTSTSRFFQGAKVNLSSGGFVLGDNATFSSGSIFNWTGGSLSIASGKTLTFDGGTGTITTGTGLSNGATIHITNAAHVTNSSYMDVGNSGDGGANGTLLIDGAGSSYITTADAFNYTLFGFNNGDFGTLTISNSGAGTFNGLHLADNGGKALVTVSSGSLNIGTFLQTGGALSTSAATINISGGRLNSTGTAIFLGGSVLSISGGGVGSFTGAATFLGGTTPDQLNISNFSAATFSGLSVGSTTVALSSGGTLTSNGTAQFNNGATLTVAGNIGNFTKFISLGNATFLTGSSASVSGFGTFTMGPSTTLAFDGGVGTFSSTTDFSLPSGSTLRVTAGGKFFDAVAVNVADGQSTGTLFVDGANSVLSSNSPFSSFWGTNTGNSAAATFSTGATGTFSGIAMADNGGAATLNVLSNAKLTLGGLNAGGSPGTATININGGTLNITGGAGFAGNSFVNYQSGSFNATSGISTSNSASISVASGAIVRTGGLTMNDTSVINLNGGLIDDYTGGTPISTIRGYLLAGRNGGLGGLWKGVGINSSTAAANSTKFAVGYADASAIGSPATFMGQPIDNTSVLARLTYNGDANLDGKVNALDFNALATNFGKTPGSDVWSQGDFNFDGSVNTQDFTLLAGNFNATPLSDPPLLGTLGSGELGRAVPEPTSFATIATLATLARRRRIHRG